MGINGLYPFIDKRASRCKKYKKLVDLSPGNAGLDGQALGYNAQMIHGNNVSAIANSIKKSCKALKKSNINPIIVFDGNAPLAEKMETNILRKESRDKQKEKKELIYKKMKLGSEDPKNGYKPKEEDPEWLVELLKGGKGALREAYEKANKNSKKLEYDTVTAVMEELQSCDIICIRSESEADFVLAHLYKSGDIQYVFADDGDNFPFGVECVIRNLSKHISAPDKEDIVVYCLPVMLKELDMTMDQFILMCIFAKSDYTKTACAGIGIATVYTAIQDEDYTTLKQLLKHFRGKYDKNTFPEKAERAFNLFKNPKSIDWRMSLVEKEHEIFTVKKIRLLVSEY